MKISAFIFSVLLVLGNSAFAINYEFTPSPKTYDIQVVKSTHQNVYSGRTDYFGLARNGFARIALFSNGIMSTLPLYFYSIYSSDGKWLFTSELFEIESLDSVRLERILESTLRGCSATFQINETTNKIVSVNQDCTSTAK